MAEFVPWTRRTESGELIGYEIDVIAGGMAITPRREFDLDRPQRETTRPATIFRIRF